ncbi:hypothetical protein Acr_03g0017990 [Actinidia rufa]|uniref:Uncharacterized protein n=1 Tax=Actinidia rufa TaxID=165716 RepID=A0A7J0EEZ6_9ERIC|nr:hypothetical protein Acr_03g0017990 [Actinidia rufa]
MSNHGEDKRERTSPATPKSGNNSRCQTGENQSQQHLKQVQLSSLSHSIIDVPSASASANPFGSVDLAKLNALVIKKDNDVLNEFGGVEGVARALQADGEVGICGDPDDLSLPT